MKLQGFRILSDQETDQIHGASLRLLQQTGVQVLSREALDLFAEAGAEVERETQRVRLPGALVEDALATLPSSFLVYDQIGRSALEVGGRHFYSVAGMDGNFVWDEGKRIRREATKQDVADFARLADALPHIHFVSPQVVPLDVPGVSALPHAFEALVANSSKPLYVTPGGGAATATVLDMAQVVAGDVPLADRPILVVYAAPTSPLVWQPDAIEALIETVRRGVPLSMSGGPLMGMGSPVTPAGTIALANAEMLAGVVLACHIRPRPPIAMAAGPLAAHMRTGIPVHADPHTLMARLAGAQMARYYHVPGVLSGPNTSAYSLDAQNGWESMFTTLALLDSGCNILVNAGEFASASTASYEQLLADNEIFGLCLKFLEGFEVDADTLATEMIERLGPGASFLAEKHTYTHHRAEYWRPAITFRETYTAWESQGSPPVSVTASERAQMLLRDHHARALPEATADALRGIRERYETRYAGAQGEAAH